MTLAPNQFSHLKLESLSLLSCLSFPPFAFQHVPIRLGTWNCSPFGLRHQAIRSSIFNLALYNAISWIDL
uniref:Uncharacterized protein n=1 Tax=Anguilla anguilla TaxID=7936 RepID=A0A0E9XHQ5_ANGAN